MDEPKIEKENFQKIILFSKNIIKNFQNKKINIIFDNNNLDKIDKIDKINKIKKIRKINKIVMKYIKDKLKKFNIRQNIQKLYLDQMKERIKFIKNPVKIDKKNKSYIEAKKEIDLFLKKTKKNPKQNYIYYMTALNKILNKFNLDKDYINNLIIYAFHQKNISLTEYYILSLEYMINVLERIIKFM